MEERDREKWELEFTADFHKFYEVVWYFKKILTYGPDFFFKKKLIYNTEARVME